MNNKTKPADFLSAAEMAKAVSAMGAIKPKVHGGITSLVRRTYDELLQQYNETEGDILSAETLDLQISRENIRLFRNKVLISNTQENILAFRTAIKEKSAAYLSVAQMANKTGLPKPQVHQVYQFVHLRDLSKEKGLSVSRDLAWEPTAYRIQNPQGNALYMHERFADDVISIAAYLPKPKTDDDLTPDRSLSDQEIEDAKRAIEALRKEKGVKRPYDHGGPGGGRTR